MGHLAELTGHTLINESFDGIPVTGQGQFIGNSYHVANVGSLMMAVIVMACPRAAAGV